MKILFLSHYFPPEVNAPATRTYEHCKRWAAAGHEITVITCQPNCPNGKIYKGYSNKWIHHEIIDNINVYRVWTFIAPNKGFILRILNYLSYMITATIQAVFTFKTYNCIIATSPQFFCGWAGVFIHFIHRWKLILEIRDIWPESIITVGAMKKSRIITILEYLEKIMYRSADHIVAVGEGYKAKIVKKKINPSKISVVINGVDPERFHKLPVDARLRQQYNSTNKFVCSYIGTIGMAHGLEVILDSAAWCLKNPALHDIMFWIVGEGALKEHLESIKIQKKLDNVCFTGLVPKESIANVIASSDACLVHLKGTELFNTVIPSKIFEIMAMETPIIMGVKGDAQKFVLEAGGGVPMIPDNSESLLSCIDEIKKRGKKSFSGREYVVKRFNRDALAHNMLEIIQREISN